MDRLPRTFAEVMSANAWMMHLPRHEGRYRHSLQRLREAGFEDVTLFKGIDGYTNSCREVADANRWEFADYLGPGELGFSLTLFLVFKAVLAEGRDWVLVFEDDVLPHPRIASLGESWWEETPRRFDLLYLGNQLDPGQCQGKVASSGCYCTHAFLVTRSGAQHMLGLIEKNVYGGLDKGDILLIKWQHDRLITHYAWFAKGSVPLPYPSGEGMSAADLETQTDVIWPGRDTGLFYQNFALGSSIHNREITYG